MTITKSITIDSSGSFASILATGTTGIIINAGPDAFVTIRHLSINGPGSGITGIRILAAKKVQPEDCYIANFTQKGIEVNTTTACTVIINNVTIHISQRRKVNAMTQRVHFLMLMMLLL